LCSFRKREYRSPSFLSVTQPIRLFYFFFYQGRHVGNSLVGLCNTPFGRPFTFLPPPQRSAIERNFRQQAPYRHRQEKATRLPKKWSYFRNGSSARNKTPTQFFYSLELPFILLSTEDIGMFIQDASHFFLYLCNASPMSRTAICDE
jgi:hypothetical protein